MTSMLARDLLVVTGKGGVGKTTLAAACGLLAARQGARTIVVELGDQQRLPALFGAQTPEQGREVRLAENLWSITIDPDAVLLEWVQELGGRIPGRVLAGSSTFQYFAAAAPGAKELFAMVKVWELAQERRWRRRAEGYDLVVLDAPATGHALGLLRSPQTFGAIARVGPVAAQAERVASLLGDADASGYLAVTLATDMAVTETLELQTGLGEAVGRELDEVVVNALLPRRFSAEEMRRIATLDGGATVVAAAAQAARAVHERAQFQHNQVARLRRRDFDVIGLPYLWGAQLDIDALQGVADQLARKL
jgi:anion-transporting  ArsA/GET3 family ATPase